MSTKFTQKGAPLVESQTLTLLHTTQDLRARIIAHLAERLSEMGYSEASPAALDFLGALECGDNHAAEIARRIGVSRQFVARQVKHYCKLGYLQQTPGHGKQIIISFTDRGEQLMADARQLLAEIDAMIAAGCAQDDLTDCLDMLRRIVLTLPR